MYEQPFHLPSCGEQHCIEDCYGGKGQGHALEEAPCTLLPKNLHKPAI